MNVNAIAPRRNFRRVARPAKTGSTSMVLAIGSKTDKEPVRHTYAVGAFEDWEDIVRKYFDDCDADVSDDEIDLIVEGLEEDKFAQCGNHFFQITELEKI